MAANDRIPDDTTPTRAASGSRSAPARATWMRLTGSGIELAFITILFGAIGAAIDRRLGLAKPACSAVGALVGFSLGMIRFLRLATSISQTQREIESANPSDRPTSDVPTDDLTAENSRTGDEQTNEHRPDNHDAP